MKALKESALLKNQLEKMSISLSIKIPIYF